MTPNFNLLKKLRGALTHGFNPTEPHPLEGLNASAPVVAANTAPPVNAPIKPPMPRLRLDPRMLAASPQGAGQEQAPMAAMPPPPPVPAQMPPTAAAPSPAQISDLDENTQRGVELPSRAQEDIGDGRQLTSLEDQMERVRIQREMKRDNAPLPERTGRGKSILRGLLQGAAQGAAGGGGLGGLIGGAAAGAVRGGVDKNWDEREARDQRLVEEERNLAGLQQQQQQQDVFTDNGISRRLKQANLENALRRPESEREKREQLSHAATARVIASRINDADEFDPDDPRNAETVALAQQYNVPVFPKRRGQQVKIVQDPRTGGFYAIGADARTGQATAAPVTNTQNHTPFVTSTTQQMSAEEKQNDRAARASLAASRSTRSSSGRAAPSTTAAAGGSDEARRTKAAAGVTRLGKLQGQLATASTGKQRESIRAQIATQGGLLRSQYGDLVEDDAQGWPTRMRAPQSAPAAGGGQTTEAAIRAAGQRRRMSEQQIGEAVRRAKERGLLR
jgi:hypothetical protein